MSEELKSITCDPKCGFSVRSHNEKELIEIALAHVKNMHPQMKVSEDEVKSWIKPA